MVDDGMDCGENCGEDSAEDGGVSCGGEVSCFGVHITIF